MSYRYGKIFFMKPDKNRPNDGDFVKIRIIEDLDGDLVGEMVEEA